MNAPAATSAAPAAPRLNEAMAARRSPEQQRAWRLWRWRELFTSLWAPLSLLALAFIPYLLVIENASAAASWALPAMQSFALAMVLYYAALLLWRLASPRERALRKLRHEAHELLAEDERIVERLRGKLSPEVTERLAEQALRVEAASVQGDVPRLEQELKGLEALTAEHLGPYRKQSWWAAASGFAIALGAALLIRTVLIEPYRIPSGSMLPTLEIGDQVFVNKFIYGVRIPFINKVPFQIVRAPQAGDVIVFNNPLDESKDFIKRVVGVPGDKVEVINEVVHLNGVPQERQLVAEDFLVHNQTEDGRWFDQRHALYEEQLGGVGHAALQNSHHPRGRVREGPFVVPAGHVFVMGDNRDNSSDSRYGLGVEGYSGAAFVPFGHIKGKAMVVWLALGHGGLGNGLFGGTGLRVDRLFLPVR